MIIENVIIVVIDSTDRKKGDFSFDFRRGGVEIPPTFVPSGGGEISWGGEFSPLPALSRGENSPPRGWFLYPLKNFLRKLCKLFLHALHMNLTITQQLFTDIFRV